jgi:hypothetical protein
MIEIKDYIYLPARKYERLKQTDRPVIRISAEAYNTLIDITEETNLSLSRVASEIITQSVDLIKYNRKEN